MFRNGSESSDMVPLGTNAGIGQRFLVNEYTKPDKMTLMTIAREAPTEWSRQDNGKKRGEGA
jgi:hypothetical protein